MKPRVAFFDFASCEGCQLQIANLEETVVDVAEMVDVISFREVMKEHSDDYDIAFVEGSIHRPIDEERLKYIRSQAKILIAMGDCACNGGVNKLRNEWAVDEVKNEVYGSADTENNPFFDVFPTKSLDEIVEVDFYIRGCPVRNEEVLYYIKRFQTMPPHKNLDLRFGITSRNIPADERSIIQYDPKKCILCRHCEVICNEALDVHAIGVSQKGSDSIISTPFDMGLDNNRCIYCGQCLVNCPVGAFSENSDVEKVFELLDNKSNFVVFVVDPLSMASCAELLPTHEEDLGIIMQKTISALKDMNAKKVIDFTQFTYLCSAAQADYIRINKEVTFTSWCPSAQNFIEKFYPQYKKYTHKESSPANLLSEIIKKRYDSKRIRIVLVTPCIAYKGNDKFDAVLTTRELPRLFKTRNIELDFYSSTGVVFDCDLGMDPRFISGGCSDYTYSLCILQAAYLEQYGNLEAALTITSIENYVHELVFDSEFGFYNALVIEDHSKVRKYLDDDITKYNVIEFYPCLRGCLNGGGQYPTLSDEDIEMRRESLRRYRGEIESPYEFISPIIRAYNRNKGIDSYG